MTLLLVLAGAASARRCATSPTVPSRPARHRVPWGTFTVNVIGSMILGAAPEAPPPVPCRINCST